MVLMSWPAPRRHPGGSGGGCGLVGAGLGGHVSPAVEVGTSFGESGQEAGGRGGAG